jgi:hypothetical protein
MMALLQRTTFKTSRAAQYVEARTLQAMTGQPKRAFAAVVTKELMDNALDACETAGVAPAITLAVEDRDDRSGAITVSDNGGGIPPEVVHGALDFSVLVSDKAVYRSPTRGAQGNALKTVFGIPHALGSLEPVVVEAKGIRHEARVWKDRAGELRIQCDDTDLSEPRRSHGTSVTAHVPAQGPSFGLFGGGFDPEYWARAFSLFNPHAMVRIRRFDAFGYPSNQGESGWPVFGDSYRPTSDPAKRFKYLPSDPTSAHWYDAASFERLVYSHISHHRREGGDDLRLREFVRQFKGLSATAKAKAVCAEFPEIKSLSDFEDHSAGAARMLLDVMKRHADAPSHRTLGAVGREHFERRFRDFYGGFYRFGYKKITGSLRTGMPYVFEFAIAEIEGLGDLFTAVNYSPTFDDPLQDVRFSSPKINAEGIEGFLEDGFAHPHYDNADDPSGPNVAVATHVITPAPLFLDQGKTRLEGFTDESEGPAIGKAMFSQLKPYHTEGKRRAKGQRSQDKSERRSAQGGSEVSFKEAIYASMGQAVTDASSGGEYPFSARDLFYSVRPLYVERTTKRLDPEKGYDTFKGILDAYQEEHGKIEGLYYDPRGRLREPHTGNTVDVGTREIEAYTFPHLAFDKILYVEKEGIWPQLEAHNLAERYDMAILTGKGYATEAARTLFEKAEEGDYQLFVLHDADPDGYNIARTLREETRRMPGYNVQVIDIGLTVEDAEDRGLLPEAFTRKKALPSTLVLNERERECFEGRYRGRDGNGKTLFSCTRYEINALKTAPQKIAYIEEKLEEKGVRGKVIPPEDALKEQRAAMFRTEIGGWVDDLVAEVLATDDLKVKMIEEFEERFKLQGAKAWIETGFARDDTQGWRDAVKSTLRAAYGAKHKDALEKAVREYIRKTVADEGDE